MTNPARKSGLVGKGDLNPSGVLGEVAVRFASERSGQGVGTPSGDRESTVDIVA